MATTFTNAYEKLFGNIEQNLKAFTVSDAIAGREAHNALLRNGGKQYQYTSYEEGTAQDVTQYSDMTIDGYTATAVTMDLDTESSYAFNLDEFDKGKYAGSMEFLQNRFTNAMKIMRKEQDGNFLNLYSDATNTFDDGDIGGTAGDAITLTSSNVIQTFAEAQATVQRVTGDQQNLMCVITPSQKAKMLQSGASNGFQVADSILRNGYQGKGFLDIDIYLSSYLSHEIVLTNTGNVSADDTLTVNGVTFTFKASPAAANEVDVGGDAETSFSNLAAAINQGAGAGSAYIAASAADARILRGLTATSTATTLTIVSKWGQMTVSESLANVTAGTQFVHNIMGEYGAIELANPFGIKSRVREEPKQLTANYISATQFGVKTPTFGKDKFLDLQINV